MLYLDLPTRDSALITGVADSEADIGPAPAEGSRGAGDLLHGPMKEKPIHRA